MITKGAKRYRIAELRRINVYWLACEGKGRRERKGRGGALGSCGGLRGGSGYMLALVDGLLIAFLVRAINQLPIASMYDHKVIEYRSVRKRDAELVNSE